MPCSANSTAILARKKVPREAPNPRPAALGDKDKAITWLEKAYEEKDDWIAFIKVDPSLDGLRAEPRFVELLRRVGLA
jgi:hypothetical protein